MRWFKEYLKEDEYIKAWADQSDKFAHLSVLQEAILIVGSKYLKKDRQVIIKENDQQVINLYEMLGRIDQSLNVIHYTHETSLRVEAISQSDVLKEERLNTIYRILKNDYDVLITHSSAIVRKISEKERFEALILNLEVSQVISRKDLIISLHQMGYQRVKYVDRPLGFSFRGGIFDVFSANYSNPIRIEFFDDEIESIRFFDIKSQRSLKEINSVELIFADEVLLTEKESQKIAATIQNKIKNDKELKDNLAISLDQLDQNSYEEQMYPYLGLWENSSSILNFISKARIYSSSIEAVKRELNDYLLDSQTFIKEQETLKQNVYFDNVFVDVDARIDKTIKIHEYQGKEEPFSLPWHQNRLSFSNSDERLRWIVSQTDKAPIVILVNQQNRKQIITRLNYLDIKFQEQNQYPKTNNLYLSMSDQSVGINFDDLNLEVFSADDILNQEGKTFRYDNKFFEAESLERLHDLGTYDYVVHRQHGVGKYMGITTRKYDGIAKDFMRIRYRDNDELFVPLEKFNLVRKYMSADASAVRLNKLGTDTWEKNKAKVKEDVAQVADKLIQIYSKRIEQKGFAFSPDNQMQEEFESEFIHPLTKDQEQAVEEIKEEMQSDSPMDRLLSGDVGFGKTEVAIRASFKAILDEKQVVFLCPTTILSKQHYNTFIDRFKNYPVRIEVLNRFIPAKKQREIIRDTKLGKVDILIGTHRVLSKDVKFKDLGFLVVDEEQRFGVQDKEKIKEYRALVDVLSLSATPIPRTLQMSLVGLRSLSQLNTPPQDRLPIMTYVIEKNKKTLHDVILKEIRRNGQVFYLFNNVSEIYNVANNISMDIEEAKVGVIHGQMDRNNIEEIMMNFVSKELNVLVCTTIIETGIDIPNANTMIVDNAHHFGLSQLYQIKGRVGRSDRLAYAYFVVPVKRNLTELAQKRLQAIKEFSELGSGYKIAMRDLSIRGAGELLGANQSGFIDTVGMELYVELLKEAIDQRKGIEVKKDTEKEININASGYLPEDFTFNDSEKLDLYQEIQGITSLKQYADFYESVEDRYGTLPDAVELLLEKVRLELLLADQRVESFSEKYRDVELVFTKDYSDKVDGIHLFEFISEMSYEIKIKYINQKIVINIPNDIEWIRFLIDILDTIKEAEK